MYEVRPDPDARERAARLQHLGDSVADPELACALHEEALAVLWASEGKRSPRAMPILASWLGRARDLRTHLTGPRGQLLDRSIAVMCLEAEALIADAEPKILSGAPERLRLFADTYALLHGIGSSDRALALLCAASP